MKYKVLGWIGIIWGGFIIVTGVIRVIGAGVGEGAYAWGQTLAFAFGGLMLFAGLRALSVERPVGPGGSLYDFATRYTAAWCSQNASSVAAFFAKHGSLTINGGTPSVGRAAITTAAQGFMTAFPDMVVTMDKLDVDEGEGSATYHWTLTGTNTGPGGTGRRVHISGYEEWTIASDGLILDSLGHFDEADYKRQLEAP